MKKFAIITDFDGTITTRDIGHALCTHFGTMKRGGEVKDYDTKEDPTLWFNKFFSPIKVSKEEFESIILSYAVVKKGFDSLVLFAQENKIPFDSPVKALYKKCPCFKFWNELESCRCR